MEHNERAVALTIAGFDGSGGAGILADVKVFEDLGCYGMAVASVLTVQNSLGVRATHPVEPEWVEAQLEAILSDGPVRAAKTGALGSVQQVRCVARLMAKWGVRALVVDPVMKASLGADLLDQPGIDALGELLQTAYLVTANAQELEVLTGIPVRNLAGAERAAQALWNTGVPFVLAKGGHLPAEKEVVDVLYDGAEFRYFRAPRVDGPSPHGTGCVLSAAITAYLAHGLTVYESCAQAREYVRKRFENMMQIGAGRPVLI